MSKAISRGLLLLALALPLISAAASLGNDEQTRKRQQHAAIGKRGIGSGNPVCL